VDFQRAQAERLWQLRVAAGVAMKSTTCCDEAFSLSVYGRMYSLFRGGTQERILGQAAFFGGMSNEDRQMPKE
jgi:hypothetical protein